MRKRILFVDDESDRLAELRQALNDASGDWDMKFVGSGAAALQAMDEGAYDVIVADMHMPGMSGASLLNEVGKRHPKTVRFILAQSADKELIMKCVLGTHQFLAKPCDPAILRASIERALVLDQWVGSESLKGLISRIRTFPSIPSLYFEVLKELNSADASAQRVGDIIAKDLAMTTKMLQLINSAFFGLPRQITDPTEAVSILGFETVKSLVLCIQVFAQFDKVKPTYFSIDKLWRHSTRVARAAKKIVQVEEAEQEMADEAFMAGLLHDLGKLVLVSNFGDQYDGAQNLARKNTLPLWEVERELFGASHAEIGAYLTGHWGLPLPIAEAAALHHTPLRNAAQVFSPLTAVHVANVLVHEESRETDGFVAPILNQEYLAKLGLADRLPLWRDALAGATPAKKATKPEPAPAVAEPRPPAPTLVPLLEGVTPQKPKRRAWLVPTFAVLAAFILLWSFWPVDPTLVSPPPAPKSSPPPTAVPASVTPSADAVDLALVPEETIAAAPARPETNAVAPHTVAAPAPANQPQATREPAPPADTKRLPAPAEVLSSLKLQSIIYNPTSPSVMINGKQLTVGQKIQGATVLSISPQHVIVEVHGTKATLSLKETKP